MYKRSKLSLLSDRGEQTAVQTSMNENPNLFYDVETLFWCTSYIATEEKIKSNNSTNKDATNQGFLLLWLLTWSNSRFELFVLEKLFAVLRHRTTASYGVFSIAHCHGNFSSMINKSNLTYQSDILSFWCFGRKKLCRSGELWLLMYIAAEFWITKLPYSFLTEKKLKEKDEKRCFVKNNSVDFPSFLLKKIQK